ncbi:hypothetical protein CASFOL_000815 [Castilleja foliolosa]|uniref:Glycoside hydrolase family 38 central domain-containing protein n=1 Tax=Castilleja foliolosa TaxID=1961234 RepID=A0ABD3EP77_9LAMI
MVIVFIIWQLKLFRGGNKLGHTTGSLADALAIAQYHEAVTGTEKQHVADDYAKRLSIGCKEYSLLMRMQEFNHKIQPDVDLSG